MTRLTLTPKELTDLELLIDARSLRGVINGLIDICHAKAEHVTENWQDAALAKRWTFVARKLDAVSVHMDVVPL